MELKQIQAEDLNTLEALTSAVEYYRAIQEELSRLTLSKDVAKESILAKFRELGLRVYDTPSGLRVRVNVRQGPERIDVSEAKSLLDPETLGKLLKPGATIVILSVRPIKAGAEAI